MERVLIVGNGYAGARAAEVLGALGGFEVLHVSDEAYPAYCRHLLPGLAAGERAPEDLFLPSVNGNGRGAGARPASRSPASSRRRGGRSSRTGRRFPSIMR